MNNKSLLGVVLATAVLAGPGFAQGLFGRSVVPSEQLAKLFGKSTAFSADAALTVTEPSGKTMQGMQMSFAMLDGKVRTEIDTAKMGGNLPPEAMAHMQQMGLGHTVNIVLPEKKVMYLIFPGMKAYLETPLGQTTAGVTNKAPTIEKTELGKETVDGHVCTKVKITGTEENGRTFEWLRWQAADLKDFPIKIEMTSEKGTVITMQYSNINQSKPDAALFAPPSDYTRYGSMQELMMGVMGGGRSLPPHRASE